MRRRRILVVDDSQTSQEVLRTQLEELGYEVVLAGSFQEAQSLPAWPSFDGYLLELRLPGDAGLDLLHSIKKDRPRALVILLAEFNRARPDQVLESYEDVWFLRKPTDIDTLSSVLKNAFEAEELRQDVERLRALAVGIKSVGQVRDLDQEFKVLLHLASDSLTADAGAVFLLPAGGQNESVTLRVGVEIPPGFSGRSFPLGGGLQRCLETQDTVRQESTALAYLPELATIFPEASLLHALFIPLLAGHKLIGAFCLYRDVERPGFGERDAAMARLYAATAAVALENLRLLEEARLAYQRQLDSQRELIQSRKLSSLGQVTAGISHEIRNPLTVILGNVDLIQKKAPGGELDTYLGRIRGQCERVFRLVSDLKAVYHPGEAPRASFRLRELVSEGLALAPPPGQVEVVTDLPEMDDAVEGDFSQLLHVVVNLLSNAYQALGHEGGQVLLGLEAGTSEVILVVRDSGPGIPESHRGRIFDPFFTTKGSAGTGLGLWISATILRSHGGSLEVQDHACGGACFHLRFPREETPLSSVPPRGAESNVEDGSKQVHPEGGAGISVLVVDDEQDILEFLRELLESEGFQVLVAGDFLQAEAKLREAPIDLVVLDENLPGGSGSEFYHRRVFPQYQLPGVLFTGSDQVSSQDALSRGFSAVVRKPARGGKILEAIRRALVEHVRPALAGG
jgi:signal transduction histidine kinase/DNA-binding response OmpR family regulator